MQLLTGPSFETAHEQVATSLAISLDPHVELQALGTELDSAYRAVGDRLAEHTAVRIETVDGPGRPE